MPSIWTIGYERLRPESLAAELEAARVERVIDVRFRPQSRKPGMSKTKLAALLAAHRIAYEHRRALGTPPDLRTLYKSGRVAQGAAAFAERVERESGADLDELAAELRGSAPRTALMCLEAEPHECHRSVLAAALQRRVRGLRVVDL